MPEVAEYLNGYSLRNGMSVAGYQITTLNIEHHSIVRWNEYSYPTFIVAQWLSNGVPSLANVQNLYNQFNSLVNRSRVIYTPAGRPYKCDFQYPVGSQPKVQYSDDFKHVEMTYVGHAKRISNAAVEELRQQGVQIS